ncbi:hypothetical protein FDP41_011781 [Naegleria fowleri]|uniref:Uncharacterized protein n=1 Tax=Naegleria fowleri TaxID=5763 RepID=A0A6A5C7Z7_NAEFO|nr:uncharacterized protein FDP41_011781 [Naegleria fowleri]KAF0981920.1 hypothetical protein FDP41_011781 [Naegleria fowleri]
MSSFNTTPLKTLSPIPSSASSKCHHHRQLSKSAQTLSSPQAIHLSHSFNVIYNEQQQITPSFQNIHSEPIIRQQPSFIRSPMIIHNLTHPPRRNSSYNNSNNNHYLFNIPQPRHESPSHLNNHESPNTQFLMSGRGGGGFLHGEEDELPQHFSWTHSPQRGSKENISSLSSAITTQTQPQRVFTVNRIFSELPLPQYQESSSTTTALSSSLPLPPPPYSEYPLFQPTTTSAAEMPLNHHHQVLKTKALDRASSSSSLMNTSPRGKVYTHLCLMMNDLEQYYQSSPTTPKRIAFHEEFVQNSQDNQIPKLDNQMILDPPPYEEANRTFAHVSPHQLDLQTKSRNLSSPKTPTNNPLVKSSPSLMNYQHASDFEKTDLPRQPIIVDPVHSTTIQQPQELQQHNDFKAIDISIPLCKSETRETKVVDKMVGDMSLEQQIDYHTQRLKELKQAAKKTKLTVRNRFIHLSHYLLALFEIVFTISIINFAVASFWRGTWVLIETYVVFNDSSPISSTQLSWFYLACGLTICFFVHIGGLVAKQANLSKKLKDAWKKCVSKKPDSKKSNSFFSKFLSLILLGLLWIFEKVFVYIAGIGCVFSWLGVFYIWDKYVSPYMDISSRAPSGWIAHGTGVGILLLLTSLRSILTAPVLSQMDRNMSFVGFPFIKVGFNYSQCLS